MISQISTEFARITNGNLPLRFDPLAGKFSE